MIDDFGQNWSIDDLPVSSFTIVPAGEYPVRVVKCTLEENSKKTGTVIKFEDEILEGEYQGCILKESINWTHTSETAQRIGRSTLREFCKSANIATFRRASDFVNATLKVSVTKETDDSGKERNNIVGYSPLNQQSIPAQAQYQAQPQAQAQPQQNYQQYQQPQQPQYGNYQQPQVQQTPPPAQPQGLVQPQGGMPWSQGR